MAVDINGDGLILLGGTSSTQGRLRLAEDSDNGTNYIELTAPASVTSNKTITLPDSTGTMVVTGGAQTIEFGAGTVSAPSITTTGDTNTGIFFPAADTIAFAEGGAEAMRIDSSGNVGIGNTSPNGRLDVTSTSAGANTSTLFLNNLSSSANSATSLVFGVSTAPTTRNATIRAINNGSNEISLAFLTSAADAPAERMRINSSGNLGIGTTSPAAPLTIVRDHVSSNGTLKIQTVTSFASGGLSSIDLSDSDGTRKGFVYQDSTGFAIETASSLPITFRAGGGERARITSDGTLFVGTTSGSNPGVGLFSNGTVNATTAASASNCVQFWNQATTGDNLFATFYTEGGGGSLRGSIDYNRGAGLTRYNTTSDATLKNIIGDSDGAKSVEILNSTRIREFAWKNDETQKSQIGVIAQELYETYKGAVSVGGDYEVTIPAVTEQRLVSEAVLDEDGNEIEAAVYETVEVEPERTETKYRPWAVDKTAFTFHLVAGWQAHEKTIKEQQARIEALEAQNAAFEARLAALEAK